MAKHIERQPNLAFGDEITYKNRKCVVLERFEKESMVYYHIYGPEVGVYTALDDEVVLIGHSDEADALFKALNNTDTLKESA